VTRGSNIAPSRSRTLFFLTKYRALFFETELGGIFNFFEQLPKVCEKGRFPLTAEINLSPIPPPQPDLRRISIKLAERNNLA
jgi:hypothetical protein